MLFETLETERLLLKNLNRIEASTSPSNEASHAILKRFGFKQEGYLRQHYYRDGMTEDSVIFALLREEYQLPSTLQ